MTTEIKNNLVDQSSPNKMLSDDDMDDDDFIPESLRDFLKDADEALNATTQMFRDELKDPNPNVSAESEDCDIHLDDLRSNMERVSILDEHTRAYKGCDGIRSDDDADFLSPVASSNPAADLTFTAAKRDLGLKTPAPAIEEEKKASFEYEAEEEYIRVPTPGDEVVAIENSDSNNETMQQDQEPKKEEEKSEAPADAPLEDAEAVKADAIENRESQLEGEIDRHAHDPASTEATTPTPDHSPDDVADPVVNGAEESAEKDADDNIPETEPPAPEHFAEMEEEIPSVGNGKEMGAPSVFEQDSENDPQSGASPFISSAPEPMVVPEEARTALFNPEMQGDTTLFSTDSSPVAVQPDPIPTDEGAFQLAQGDANTSDSLNEVMERGKEEITGLTAQGEDAYSFSAGAEKPISTPETGAPQSMESVFEIAKDKQQVESPLSSPTRDSEIMGGTEDDMQDAKDLPLPEEKPEVKQESRSLFGAFSSFTSFARSVVPSSTSPARDRSKSPPKSNSEATQQPTSPQVTTDEQAPSDSPGTPRQKDLMIDAPVANDKPPPPLDPILSNEEASMDANSEGDKFVDTQSEQANQRVLAASPSPSVSSTEDMMEKSAAPQGEAMDIEPLVEPAIEKAEAMTIETPVDVTCDLPMKEAPQKKAAAKYEEDTMIKDSKAGKMPSEVIIQKGVKNTANDAKENKKVVESSPQKDQGVKLSASHDTGSITSHGSLLQRKDIQKPPKSMATNTAAGWASKTPRPLLSPKSRLMQPTTASRLHQSAEQRSTATPASKIAPTRHTPSSGKQSTPTRIPVPTTVRITTKTPLQKQPQTTPAQAKNRFMQPTAAQLRHKASSSPVSKPTSSTVAKRAGGVSSRLMKGTASSKSRTPTPVLPQKRNVPNDAVARARERVRIRKLEEAKKSSFQAGSPTFSMGTKPKSTSQRTSKSGSPRFAAPTSSTIAHHKPDNLSAATKSAVFFGRIIRDDSPRSAVTTSTRTRALTVPKTPKFATTTSRSATSRLSQPTSASRAKAAAVPMAQSHNFFNKGLRGASTPPSKAPTRQGLTIPEGPKFSSTIRSVAASNKRVHQEKPTVSLAQSTNLLANTLRSGYDSAPPSKRTTLTRPQAPKFHTIHKRPLPKSSEELEAEKMTTFRARPFKAATPTRPQAPKFHTTHKRAPPKSSGELDAEKMKTFKALPYKPSQKPVVSSAAQKSLHTGSSAGLTRVAKRGLTTPAPFKLSSGSSSSRSTRMKPTTAATDRASARSATTQFRARPLPASSRNTGVTGTKRPLTTPQPFRCAASTKPQVVSSVRNKPNQSSAPKLFKARPLPKTTFKGPAIAVHSLTSPQKENTKKESHSN